MHLELLKYIGLYNKETMKTFRIYRLSIVLANRGKSCLVFQRTHDDRVTSNHSVPFLMNYPGRRVYSNAVTDPEKGTHLCVRYLLQ